MCDTAPSPFSLCFSPLLSNLRGLRLEVGSKLKDIGIDGGGTSDKSIECLSVYVVSKAGKFTHWFPCPLATKASPETSVSML